MTNLLTANSKNVMAVFSGLSADAFDGTPAQGRRRAPTRTAASSRASRSTRRASIVAGTADGAKSATAYVAKPGRPASRSPPPTRARCTSPTRRRSCATARSSASPAPPTRSPASTRAISKIKLLDTGYAFAVSGKGVFVSSPDKKNNGKLSLAQLAEQKHNPELEQIAESIAAGTGGQIETEDPFTGKDIVLTWSKIDSAGWSFLTAVPVSEVLAPVNGLRTALFVIGLIMLLLSRSRSSSSPTS